MYEIIGMRRLDFTPKRDLKNYRNYMVYRCERLHNAATLLAAVFHGGIYTHNLYSHFAGGRQREFTRIATNERSANARRS